MATVGATFSALLNTFTGAISLLQNWGQPGDARPRRDNASMRTGKSSISSWYAAVFTKKQRSAEKEDPPRSSLRRIVRRLRETLAFVFRSFSPKTTKKRDYDLLPDAPDSSKSHAIKSKADRSDYPDSRARKSSRRSKDRPTSTRSHDSASARRHSSKALVLNSDEKAEKKSHRQKDEKYRGDKDGHKSERTVSRSSLSSTRSRKSGELSEKKREKLSEYGDKVKESRSSTSRRHEERKERKSSGLSTLLKRKKL